MITLPPVPRNDIVDKGGLLKAPWTSWFNALWRYLIAAPPQNYSLKVPLTGDTIIVPDGTPSLLVKPAAAIAALTVLTPVNPVDGQALRVATTQTITTLTMTANTGQTLATAYATALNAGTGIAYQYVQASTTWIRTQ